MTEYLFDIYQDNLKSVFTKVNKLLESTNVVSNEKAESVLSDADTQIKEADKIVSLNLTHHR
jgi:hypothetical protein